jgi:hypothetical protein
MKFWDKLTKAKVVRTENELKVEVFSIGKLIGYLAFIYLILLPFTLFFPNIKLAAVLLLGLMIYVFRFIDTSIKKANHKNFSVERKVTGKTLIQGKALETAIFIKPYFIDIFVSPFKNNIRVLIENKGLFIGHYTLKNGEDLTKLIDGFTELLDLELYENNKLSDGEVLSFKSKNSAIEPYSGLWIRTPNNKLMISSLPNTSHWIELDLMGQILKNRKTEFALKEIEKIVIQDGRLGKMNVDIITKQGKTKTIFKHQVSEITMIRDKKRLLETLQNQVILGDIEIEVA